MRFMESINNHDPPYTGEEVDRMLATVTPILAGDIQIGTICLLYTSPSPRD